MMMSPECVAPTGCLQGEGPVWSPSEGFLWWVDVRRAKLHRYNPKTGNTRRYDLPVRASSLALYDGSLLMAGDREIGVFDPASEVYERLCRLDDEPEGNRTSDGGVAPDGSFWFGTMDDAGREPTGQYYRYGADKAVSLLRLPSVLVTKTMQFSPDGRTFYTCDTAEGEILAFDADPATGALSGRRTFAFTHELGGLPHGAAVDSEGGLWVCLHGASRVVRYLPDGTLDQTIIVAAPLPTGCAIGGRDMRTLFITTARTGLSFPQLDARPLSGSLFAVEVDVPGLPPRSFGKGG
ncbi:SMP-30/gluconolactonase/LRE family protein [Hyphomonas sp.]|uniref:SMP-30/gluconolactonase/LRE family protein n=1 Tax=Hyphomonas sp. TaxID=87 RepID=UPI003919B6BF